MNIRIVSDSSANLLQLDKVDFATVPLHVIVGTDDFIDNEHVDLVHMQQALSSFKGKTSTSCPSPQEWHDAFGNADLVFCIAITSNLSGSHASAVIAADMYMDEHPERKVYVFDSLSTGPEMVMIIEKLRELILVGKSGEDIHKEVTEYMKTTHLFFSLASLDNFAKNGRINPIIAKGVGLLGIRIVGRASDVGTLEPMDKCRGDHKAFKKLIEHMKNNHYQGGRVIIAHNDNAAGAEELKDLICKEFGQFNGFVHETRALCSYYAEPQSILLGFEG